MAASTVMIGLASDLSLYIKGTQNTAATVGTLLLLRPQDTQSVIM